MRDALRVEQRDAKMAARKAASWDPRRAVQLADKTDVPKAAQ
jgi:hypothetical protein